MRTYSPFFETLYDQSEPVGSLGRGTHYSVLRAIVFHDDKGDSRPQDRYLRSQAKYHDFAIIWDEDHDTRVLDALHKIYAAGLLPLFSFFGERKAFFFALASADSDILRHLVPQRIEAICSDVAGDYWTSEVGVYKQPSGIISDSQESVLLYLENINMLWKLGSKPIALEPI